MHFESAELKKQRISEIKVGIDEAESLVFGYCFVALLRNCFSWPCILCVKYYPLFDLIR